ncbi:MAG: energy transducer TonB [Terriglobales bacterium]
MFQTLETTWDRSSRRRWSTLASFTMQALALSLLLAVPLIWMQGPPRPRWLESSIVSPPSSPAPPPSVGPHPAVRGSQIRGEIFLQPATIPVGIAPINVGEAPPAPGLGELGVPGGTDLARRGVLGSIGGPMAIAPPPAPAPTRPLRVSQWAEGNLVYRVQPTYPLVAREARIQGPVRLRAIISKTGVIENLEVLGGHAMLVAVAVEAVRKWRYRPYMLNGEPIEVETEITVNFTLAGG